MWVVALCLQCFKSAMCIHEEMKATAILTHDSWARKLANSDVEGEKKGPRPWMSREGGGVLKQDLGCCDHGWDVVAGKQQAEVIGKTSDKGGALLAFHVDEPIHGNCGRLVSDQADAAEGGGAMGREEV